MSHASRIVTRYKTAGSPFDEFETPEDKDALLSFLSRLVNWMGYDTPVNLKELYAIWQRNSVLQGWLKRYVNPSSVTLYHGARWETSEPLPAIGSTLTRPFKVLQWSTHSKTARAFAGIGMINPRKSYPEWVGGVLTEALASGSDIIVDTDALSRFCAQHREAFLALGPTSDVKGVFSGEQWEGEVLTTNRVQGKVIEAVTFPPV